MGVPFYAIVDRSGESGPSTKESGASCVNLMIYTTHFCDVAFGPPIKI